MANAAGNAGHSERDIRQQLIESRTVDVMIAIEKNFTFTGPVTLWFLTTARKGANEKIRCCSSTHATCTDRSTSTLRLSARTHRIHCEHRPPLPRRRRQNVDGSDELMATNFPDGAYVDVPGLADRNYRRNRNPRMVTQPRPLHRNRRRRRRRG